MLLILIWLFILKGCIMKRKMRDLNVFFVVLLKINIEGSNIEEKVINSFCVLIFMMRK